MKKLLSLLLAAAMVFSLAACGNDKPSEKPTDPSATYTRAEDDDIYYAILEEYEKLVNEAETKADLNERFVLFAKAEAMLLDSAIMIPTTTQGGQYAMTRVAPRTIPYVQWGNDDDRLKGMVIASDFVKAEDRAAMLEIWKKAVAGEGKYDPKAYMTEKGYSIIDYYTTTFSTAPVTIDWVNTSSQSDTEITVNLVDGLVEYNNLGLMQPALAESWTISDDKTQYVFKIREGVYWCDSEGTPVIELKAKDFEAGFRHMLDAKAGLEWLIDGVVVGGTDYYSEGGAWENVGYKATGDYELTITLEKDIPYFLTMLTYSCFLPISEEFYVSRGGVFGVEEFANRDTATYQFGVADDVASQVYCGPFVLRKLQKDSEIVIAANPNYWNKEAVTLSEIRWVYDLGENVEATYKAGIDGTYTGLSLSTANGTLEKAKEDGNFDKFAYVTDTTSTTYFGGLNLNRGTYALESGACASKQTEQQKIDTHTALLNKNFRKALQHAFDKATWNAVQVGDELKNAKLRNMYTHPEFCQLSEATKDADGHEFPAGTFYGEMVQYYIDQLGAKIIVKDGVDGWFNADAAKEYLAAAVEELGDKVTYPINIDVVYYSANDVQVAQANAYKQMIENTLGADKVQVILIEATTSEDFYACGYRATTGEAGLFDMFYGSGWGPDYGDPSTYLDTFKGQGAGYMTKVCGLY